MTTVLACGFVWRPGRCGGLCCTLFLPALQLLLSRQVLFQPHLGASATSQRRLLDPCLFSGAPLALIGWRCSWRGAGGGAGMGMEEQQRQNEPRSHLHFVSHVHTSVSASSPPLGSVKPLLNTRHSVSQLRPSILGCWWLSPPPDPTASHVPPPFLYPFI